MNLKNAVIDFTPDMTFNDEYQTIEADGGFLKVKFAAPYESDDLLMFTAVQAFPYYYDEGLKKDKYNPATNRPVAMIVTPDDPLFKDLFGNGEAYFMIGWGAR